MSRGCPTNKIGQPIGAREINEDDGKVYTYFNCPLLFVPANIWKFLSVYKYYQDYPSAPMPRFREASVRFLQASKVYERNLAKFMKGK